MERKYGVYPGSLKDKEDYLKQCTQLELFLIIREKNKYIKFLLDDFQDAGYEYCDISEERYALDYAMCMTKRFNVLITENQQNNERVKKDKSFLTWYNWYNDYVMRNFSEEELKIIEQKIFNGASVSNCDIPILYTNSLF